MLCLFTVAFLPELDWFTQLHCSSCFKNLTRNHWHQTKWKWALCTRSWNISCFTGRGNLWVFPNNQHVSQHTVSIPGGCTGLLHVPSTAISSCVCISLFKPLPAFQGGIISILKLPQAYSSLFHVLLHKICLSNTSNKCVANNLVYSTDPV